MDMRGVGGGESAAGSFSYANLAPPERKQYSHRQNHDGSFLSASQMMDSAERDPVSGGSKHKPTVRYRECLKNHAANIGGNVVDGCGEFMPTGEEGSLEALKCAACDCHRNFHRKEVDGETQFSSSCRRRTMMVPLPLPLPSPTASLHHHHQFSMGFHGGGNNTATAMVQPMNVAFGGGGSGGTESSSEDLNAFHSNHNNNNADGGTTVTAPPYALQKKRSRTKFTAEQKSKMVEFAEKVGWRFQRQEEEEIERFCAEVGVKRQVFKVWMHNNKNIIAMKKQEAGADHAAATTTTTTL